MASELRPDVGIQPLIKIYKEVKVEEESTITKEEKKACIASQPWRRRRANKNAKEELSCDLGHKS